MTGPAILDASGSRQLEGGYDEFDGFLWLTAGRDFRYYFAFIDGENHALRFPNGKLTIIIGTKPERRWDCPIVNTSASIHIPWSEASQVPDGTAWTMEFIHPAGSTEVVAEGFVRLQDGCGGKSAPLLPPPAPMPPPIVMKFP